MFRLTRAPRRSRPRQLRRRQFEALESRQLMDAALDAVLVSFNEGIQSFRNNADRMTAAAWTKDIADIPLLKEQPARAFGVTAVLRSAIPGGALAAATRDAAIAQFQSLGYVVDYLDVVPNAAGNLLEVRRIISQQGIAGASAVVGGAEGFDYLNGHAGALAGSLTTRFDSFSATFRFIVDAAGFHIGADSKFSAAITAQGALAGQYTVGALGAVEAAGDATFAGTLSFAFRDRDGDGELTLQQIVQNANVLGHLRGNVNFAGRFRAELPGLAWVDWTGNFTANLRDKNVKAMQRFGLPDYSVLAQAAREGLLAQLRDADWFQKLESYLNKDLPLIGKSIAELIDFEDRVQGLLDKLDAKKLTKAEASRAMSDLINGKVVDLLKFEYEDTINLWEGDVIPPQRLYDVQAFFGLASAELDAYLKANLAFSYKVHAGVDTDGVYIGADTQLGLNGVLEGGLDGSINLVGYPVLEATGSLALVGTIFVQPQDRDGDGRLHLAEIAGGVSDNLYSYIDVDLEARVKGYLLKIKLFDEKEKIADVIHATIIGDEPPTTAEARSLPVTQENLYASTPTNVRLGELTAATAEIRWDAVAGQKRHAVLASTDDGASWRFLGEPATGGATRLVVPVQAARSYLVRVAAIDDLESAPSAAVGFVTPDGTIPVDGLRLVANSPSEVEVRWDEVQGEDFYRVFVSTNGGASWSKQEDVPADHAYSAKLTVQPGTAYQFKVVAFNQYGGGKPSNVLPVTTPTGLVDVDGLRLVSKGPREVEIRWDEAAGEDFYRVLVSTDGGASWSKQEDVPADHAYSAKLAVQPGTSYQFKVLAFTKYGHGRASNVISVATPDGRTAAPGGLRVVSVSPREVEVRWDEVSGEQYYQVQVSANGGASWSKQEDVPADHAYSAKLTVEPGRSYAFRVVAINEFGASDPSNVVTAATPDGRPAAPANLRAVAVAPRDVELRWDEVAGEDSYRVFVSRDGGASWTLAENVPANHAYSVHVTVEPNRNYSFKVDAVNAYGASPDSNVIQVRTAGEPPAAPEQLQLVAKGTNEVEVKWKEVAGEDKYTVQVSTDGGATWRKQEDVPANHAYSAKLTVTKGKTYWFRVIAVNEFGASLPSNVLKVVM